MACKQFSEFEKAKIMAYNHSGPLLCEIAKKLNRHHLSIDVAFLNY